MMNPPPGTARDDRGPISSRRACAAVLFGLAAGAPVLAADSSYMPVRVEDLLRRLAVESYAAAGAAETRGTRTTISVPARRPDLTVSVPCT